MSVMRRLAKNFRRGALTAPSLLLLLLSERAQGAYYYVDPAGSGEECSRAAPCALPTGVERAVAGDTVVLQDGTYSQGMFPKNSGTPEAWITFRADDCALPILEGQGESAPTDEEGGTPSGVYMNEATYLRFVGIVSRYWDSGFTNGWTGETTEGSNGHIEYVNCIADGNSRTGFAMYSARGLTVRECIAAHSGGSPTHSWSSGIQLYAVKGTPEENIVERSVSFENADAQKRNDGSGFIVDEDTTGATFLSNIGFRNGGSCMRLTRSPNARMINFSCYHNGMNPDANSPTNPGEFYWTDQISSDATLLANTIAAASGSSTDPTALRFPPDVSLLVSNLTIDSGETPFFTDPAGANPDFRPPAGALAQVENLGASEWAPDVDIGFDPKCIIKANPGVPYQQAWWEYSIDYEYIRSLGGAAQCFHPKARSSGADLGAYELTGEAHAFSTPGTCVRGPDPDPGTGGTAGSGGSGSGESGSGGEPAAGGAASGGAASAPGAGGSGAGAAGPGGPESGCGCRLGPAQASSASPLLLLVLGVGLARRRRRAA